MDNFTDSCPKNLEDTIKASTRFGCGRDRYGNDQYMCLPNKEKTGLVEFCHNDIMGITDRGFCLETTEGKLLRSNCSEFLEGCPDNYFHINEIYKYPACLKISTQHHCYLADPSCRVFRWDTTSEDTSRDFSPQFTLNHAYGINDMKVMGFQFSIKEDDSEIIGAIVGSLVAVVVTIILLLVMVWTVSRRRRTQKKKHCIEDASDALLRTGKTGEDQRSVDNLLPTANTIDDLTDEELSMSFCFLCSEFCPPDFKDAECLDILNEIRKIVFRPAKNPFTSEEAQQAQQNLESCDFLWERSGNFASGIPIEILHKITSKDGGVVFWLSSFDTTKLYLRSSQYNEKPGEECLKSTNFMYDVLLIRRLQLNILTHVIIEDPNLHIVVYKTLNIPNNLLEDSIEQRKTFLSDLRKQGKAVDYRGGSKDSVHVTWLSRSWRPDIVRSCIGLHQHNDIYIIDNEAYRKPSKYHDFPSNIRCLLYCLLLAEKYQMNVNEESQKITSDKIKDRYFSDVTDDSLPNLPEAAGIAKNAKGVLTFESDDIRHDVMYAFVTECLVKDSDLEFFLTTASRDVISEYCRSWDYEKSEGERCLYIPDSPEEMYELFVDKLQLEILLHCTVKDMGIHRKIRKLGVPGEILLWDMEARQRYLEVTKRGTKTIHHARGMIVGCAGAGKTTLLKRLLRCSEEEINGVKSTEGLEVHEEIFEICDETKTLKARKIDKDNKCRESCAKKVDAKTLTLFDFGGQCAYYACHQIYLTRRAFYIVVLDASKRLDQRVDNKICDQNETMFSEWTYGDYFVFWIKSIYTYCCDEREKAHNSKYPNTNSKDLIPTILIVATHWEEEHRQYQDKQALFDRLQQQFPKSSNLSKYVKEVNCYITQFPVKPLHDLETRVSEIALDQKWKEYIPKEWIFFENEISLKKQEEKGGKIINLDKFPKNEDMLRYYHDAGKVLYFNEEGIKEVVIIDVQWFVDAFKHIITDKLHLKGIDAPMEDWEEYYMTGNLKDELLEKIWEHKGDILYKPLLNEEMGEFKDEFIFALGRCVQNNGKHLMQFMQRLGLLALGQESHYVPCMNRKKKEKEISKLIEDSERSSVLVYKFTFLPIFFFFRLVVACMQENGWKVRTTHGTSCLYRDAALFSFAQYHVVLSVTEESIQLQVLHSLKGCVLETDKTQKIQEIIEDKLNNFSGQFNRNLLFVKGLRCQIDSANITEMNIKDYFLSSKHIQKDDQNMVCPLHSVIDPHFINCKDLSKYWKI